MYGHVFQLAEENQKNNQFTQTMEALKDYVASELDHPLDLGPLFRDPCEAAVIDEPDAAIHHVEGRMQTIQCPCHRFRHESALLVLGRPLPVQPERLNET